MSLAQRNPMTPNKAKYLGRPWVARILIPAQIALYTIRLDFRPGAVTNSTNHERTQNVTALAQGKSGVTRFDGHATPPECHAAVQGRAGASGCRTPNTRPRHRPVREKERKEKPRVPKPSTYRHRDPYRNTKFWAGSDLSGETSFQYYYVKGLHNRIGKGWRLAQDSVDESRLLHEPKSKLKHFVPGDEVWVLLPTSDNKLVLSFKGPYRVIEKRTSVVYLVDLSDRKYIFHVNRIQKYKRSTYASPSPSGNLDNVDNACSNQAVLGAVSLCDPSVFPFGSVSSVEASLSADTVVDKELRSHPDSELPFCETICFAEPTAYVSAISEEDGGEVGSLVTTPPLASESGTVVIDPSLSSSQVQDVKELLGYSDICSWIYQHSLP
ncbi:reverse transcriptase [Plakobranchus ocellatus]|uniref:Reverse transcriptase n=1 Tax=Plakobranchus ocellatus TaxID=259542 RepID=A0AAV4BBQ1_9GAST|nr:reverse transcriptase [Plakobranchus ocellatus]